MVSVFDQGENIVSCPLAPGQSWIQGAELGWPARFGSRRNGWAGLSVDQPTLIALLGRLLVTGDAFRAFNLDPSGVVTVIDVNDRVRRFTPDEQLNYDLVSLDDAYEPTSGWGRCCDFAAGHRGKGGAPYLRKMLVPSLGVCRGD